MLIEVISFFLRAYSISASDRRNLKSGQAQPHIRPWTAEMQGQPSEDQRRRLGLHRPGVIILFSHIDVLQVYFHSAVKTIILDSVNLFMLCEFCVSDLSAKGPSVSSDPTWYAQ